MFEVEELGNGLMLVNVPEWVLWVVVIWAFLGMLDAIFRIVIKILNWRISRELKFYAEREIVKQVGDAVKKDKHG